MISLTGEYALRAVVCLAAHQGMPLTADRISAYTDVSVGYMAKILQGLNRSGLVTSQRGPHGGFTLRHHPDTLTVFDVVKAADQLPRHPETAMLGTIQGPRTLLHRLHTLLARTRDETEKAFKETTIGALMHEGDQGGPPPVAVRVT